MSEAKRDRNALLRQRREEFIREGARHLVSNISTAKQVEAESDRFAVFESDDVYIVAANDPGPEYKPKERRTVDLALAYGLTWCADKPLWLILPSGWEFPTQQRAAWLKDERQPRVFVHGGGKVEEPPKFSREESSANLAKLLLRMKAPSFDAELQSAMTRTHLGARDEWVWDLVEWATKEAQLDPGHRGTERSWQCVGRRVLSINPVRNGLELRAGIHNASVKDRTIPIAGPLTIKESEQLKEWVRLGISERLDPKGDYPPDENWLQAVVQREPKTVGIEHPALREVPSWRPRVSEKYQWGRGRIDLLGVDGHGNIRLVEAKLASNADAEFVLQGLDYYVWAQGYLSSIRARLGAPKNAEVEVHYVIGAENGVNKVSGFAKAQAAALTIPWKRQTVVDWDQPPGRLPAMTSTLADEMPA